jgi:hypothetical protein
MDRLFQDLSHGYRIGIVGALVLTRWLASFLYGIGPTDPATFARGSRDLGQCCAAG